MRSNEVQKEIDSIVYEMGRRYDHHVRTRVAGKPEVVVEVVEHFKKLNCTVSLQQGTGELDIRWGYEF